MECPRREPPEVMVPLTLPAAMAVVVVAILLSWTLIVVLIRQMA